MLGKITLTPEDITYKQHQTSNLLLQISLDDLWEELRLFDQICLESYIAMPVRINGEEKKIGFTILTYYKVSTIDLTQDSISVIQKGYYDGECIAESEIGVSCYIWGYSDEEIK